MLQMLSHGHNWRDTLTLNESEINKAVIGRALLAVRCWPCVAGRALFPGFWVAPHK
jgi:hypothetical protein